MSIPEDSRAFGLLWLRCQLADTLEQVCREHNISDPLEQVIEYIRNSRDVEAKLQIQPTVLVTSIQNTQLTEPTQTVNLSGDDLAQALQGGQIWHLIDVRSPEEWEQGHLPDAQMLTTELKFEMLDSWPKNTPILFYSNSGRRGLETASYFVAYGFSNVRNLAGGVRTWRSQQPHPDELVPRRTDDA